MTQRENMIAAATKAGQTIANLRPAQRKRIVKGQMIDMRDTDFDIALRPLCDWLAAQPQNQLIGNLNAIIDNLNEFGTDYTITLKY